MHHQLNLQDGTTTHDTMQHPVRRGPKRAYEAVNPIQKNGQSYAPGEYIFLDPVTAQGFLAVGDVKEIP